MNEERTAAADVCKFASGDRVVESDVRSDGGVPNPVRHLKFKFALEHGLLVWADNGRIEYLLNSCN